ncbi:tRNA guanosine(34) transglycosylase Tgt [Pseudothermotoga lettingae]|uniref:tRNA guanosine(34) transglycosylase Tgt n=1 Tax=Pseudothermotoga lettingae TaxID=177758 RepID=UPI0007498E94|nr:MAG: Queuine tRNA-ribosyltransferase [Pseudothermotoga lettingae]
MCGRLLQKEQRSCFEIVSKFGEARVGKLHTNHGDYETPIFMPVGTNANVKLTDTMRLKEIGAGIILGNSYHLAVRPGLDVIRLHGGLHQFMGWKGGILTDSGGFQVFSLRKLRDIGDDGVLITSPVDGSKMLLTPELSMEIQSTLNSDIVMVLDHCPGPEDSYTESMVSAKRTYNWAMRCLKHGVNEHQLLFAIAQGGVYEDLRKLSAEQLSQLPFDGFAIGGLSLGEPFEKTLYLTQITVSALPFENPRYFMGGGSPALIIQLVEMGVDMFDSVFPTRLARHGAALTWKGRLNIKSARFKRDLQPIEENCDCFVCQNYSKSYLHHLFDRKEVLGGILLTYHNLHFMMKFMNKIRNSIEDRTFKTLKREVLDVYGKGKKADLYVDAAISDNNNGRYN